MGGVQEGKRFKIYSSSQNSIKLWCNVSKRPSFFHALTGCDTTLSIFGKKQKDLL